MQGAALYIAAILGAGVLVLPGQVASMAGPASLISWAIASLLGVPLATMFALLVRKYPDAGGISTYAAAAFGPRVGGITGWLFFVAGSVGQTIVPLTGGYYVSHALGGGVVTSFLIALGILVAATAANLAGLRVGARTQLGIAATVAVALALTIAVSVQKMSLSRLEPFAPHGLAPIGSGVVILFFAFAGWEAIAHLAGEFRNPQRDVPRAVAATIVVVSLLYMGTACAVVLTGTYGSAKVDRVAIGLLLQSTLGPSAMYAAAVLAIIISFGTTNAFIAGVSRLAYSLARDGWLPAPTARVARSGIPVGGVLTVSSIAATGLAMAMALGWGVEQLLIVPSTLVVVVYVVAAAAATRVLDAWGRVSGLTTLVITFLVLPTAASHAIVPIIVAALALVFRRAVRRRRPAAAPTPTDKSYV